jgi:hypothetical protein
LGLFAHVVYDHKFKDEELFYRFNFSSDGNPDSEPPGSFGVPVLGETLSLQSDVQHFFTTKGQRYQGFFKTNVVFNKCVGLSEKCPSSQIRFLFNFCDFSGFRCAVFADPESMSIFYDESIIQRENSMPPHWVVRVIALTTVHFGKISLNCECFFISQ